MRQDLEQAVAAAVQELFSVAVSVELTRPDEHFGDYATNVALQLSKQLGKNPREIAEALAVKIRQTLPSDVQDVSVAGPGFLNITLSDAALTRNAVPAISTLNQGKRVLLEYSCPNAFKELHTGHLYNTIAGDAIGKLLEATGATVFRANFGGDVGMHVAKCLYGIVEKIGGEFPEKLADIPANTRAEWLSSAYVQGASAFEAYDVAKARIGKINSSVYGFHETNEHDSPLAQLYWTCREWSYDYFKDFYNRIEVAPFDKFYPESSTIQTGMDVVRANMGSVFVESDGAVVFKGEEAGLHTRVFVTSKGLPTYEAKDTGVIYNETKDFTYDKRVVMTGNDQTIYMQVVFAALQQFDPDLAAKQTHVTNGTVRFGTGQKMSSRLGNVTRAVDVLEEVSAAVLAERPDADVTQISLAAIKYSFLRHRLGGDIAFDIKDSVSLEGNSGPYLQYAHARARSVLAKASSEVRGSGLDSEAPQLQGEILEHAPSVNGAVQNDVPQNVAVLTNLTPDERSLVRKIAEYSEVVDKATAELLPHYICTYLYELAQKFNQFYEHNRVIGDEREVVRLALVERYAGTLKSGLNLLGITAPEHM